MIDLSFQGTNRLFVLLLENETTRIGHTPNVEIKEYNVMIEDCNIFDQPIKNDIKTNENIRKITTGNEDDYTTGCLLDYPYLKEDQEMIAIDLNKQQVLNADLKAIQQTDFTGSLDLYVGWGINFIQHRRSQLNYCKIFARNCKSVVNAFSKFIWY